jgi:hypothetical protein
MARNAEAVRRRLSSDELKALFWDIVNKVDKKQDPATIAALNKVKDPDPNDPNDLMPLQFSKYLSIYAMAVADNDLSGARTLLFDDNSNLQSGMSTNLYDRVPIGCAKLEELRNNYVTQYNDLTKSSQDLSGRAIAAGSMRDENMAYQNANIDACKGSPSPACISLASQEAPVFSLLAKFDNVNDVMVSAGFIDLSNNIDIINTAYTRMGCSGSRPIQFSPNDTGMIDTETLIKKLNEMSPYYLSPDTLQYITSSIISTSDTNKNLMTDAGKLENIKNVIANIKSLTGTT